MYLPPFLVGTLPSHFSVSTANFQLPCLTPGGGVSLVKRPVVQGHLWLDHPLQAPATKNWEFLKAYLCRGLERVCRNGQLESNDLLKAIFCPQTYGRPRGGGL